jgi:hypothetical protein
MLSTVMTVARLNEWHPLEIAFSVHYETIPLISVLFQACNYEFKRFVFHETATEALNFG